MYSEYYGEYSDYTRKGGVVFSEILLPANAPREYADRQTLWNAVEKAETNKKAQLAYSFDIALQNEFSMEENIALAKKFLSDEYVSRGMIVDYAIHLPDKEGTDGIPNPHIHFMCPIRPLKGNGEWDAKQHREYLFNEDSSPVLDASGHKKFNAIPTTDWGQPETLEHWRQAWADLCNAEFAKKGIDEHIDHRSYERQGADRIPTVHEGPAVRQMEKKGISTGKGSLNQFIRSTNRMIAAAMKKLAALRSWIAELKDACSEPGAPESPNLVELLSNYYDRRNTGAWSRKAKINNLKSFAEAVAFLKENGISTLSDLEHMIAAESTRSDSLRDSMNIASVRMKTLDELLRMAEFYRDNKPAYDALSQIRFKKAREKYEAGHENELRLFYMARRKLKPYFSESGELPETEWQKELDGLREKYQRDRAMYSSVYRNIRRLSDIRYCVDEIFRETNEHTSPARNHRQETEL
ncbi:MAG: MobA/MobL family protein [Lachnospiraceae bacterium]|nr:MobA/MobL family protein [Lachnospiraceae bacterium]